MMCSQLMRHPLMELFLPLQFASNENDRRMVNAEFFGNFLCSSKRISFNDPLKWLLSTFDVWPLCLSSSRHSSPLQNLKHHFTVHLLAAGSNALLMLWVISAALRLIWTWIKKSLEFTFCLYIYIYIYIKTNKYIYIYIYIYKTNISYIV